MFKKTFKINIFKVCGSHKEFTNSEVVLIENGSYNKSKFI